MWHKRCWEEFHSRTRRVVSAILQVFYHHCLEFLLLLIDRVFKGGILAIVLSKLAFSTSFALFLLWIGLLTSTATTYWWDRLDTVSKLGDIRCLRCNINHVQVVLVSLYTMPASLLKHSLERVLFILDLIVDLFHVFDSSWSHERVMPSTSHVIKALLSKRIYLVSPCKENRLVNVLAGLIIRSCHSEQSFIRDFARKPTNLLESLFSLLEARDK